jgi:hypothetical protein
MGKSAFFFPKAECIESEGGGGKRMWSDSEQKLYLIDTRLKFLLI